VVALVEEEDIMNKEKTATLNQKVKKKHVVAEQKATVVKNKFN
jgi:hypothetical protein